MTDFLSIVFVTFSLVAFFELWLIWVFCVRTQECELQPSPHSKVTPLGTYGPRR